MCGLYGLICPTRHPLTEPRQLRALAEAATERGTDSAGFAVHDPARGWLVQRVLDHRRLRFPASVTTLLGHARHATQGAITLAQASPLLSGRLLGTHNGDLDIDSLPHNRQLGTDATDSQYLFAALEPVHQSMRFRTSLAVRILSTMRGRAALAWVDTQHPSGRVWLARAGLSPLAVGTDTIGRIWWGSNPDWLVSVCAPDSIRMLDSGTLLCLTPSASRVTCRPVADFKPTIRRRDLRLGFAVWRGFHPLERQADEAHLRHRIR